MSIGRIGTDGVPVPRLSIGGDKSQNGDQSFSEALAKALADVNSSAVEADRAAAQLASGQADNLQQVVMATEKANLALQFTMAIRNKVVDAYNEIMRMPV